MNAGAGYEGGLPTCNNPICQCKTGLRSISDGAGHEGVDQPAPRRCAYEEQG